MPAPLWGWRCIEMSSSEPESVRVMRSIEFSVSSGMKMAKRSASTMAFAERSATSSSWRSPRALPRSRESLSVAFNAPFAEASGFISCSSSCGRCGADIVAVWQQQALDASTAARTPP
eukprot:6198564-Pleurochrysis_carterae.AAC.1